MEKGEIVFKKDCSGIVRKIYLSEQEGRTPENLWDGDRFGTTRKATAEIKELFDGIQVFDTPKPKELIMSMLQIATSKADIILDFFSGSATTAHAVMQLNADDGGKRKFIMVQLPEVCGEKSEAANAGFANICAIGKERIRRAGAKIGKGDTGFRVLKLDSSNMKDVYYTPEEYDRMGYDVEGFADNIKEDRTDEDLLFQVMLDLGIELSAKIKRDGRTFYVNGNYLIAHFGATTLELLTNIAKQKPYYAVFRDSGFGKDGDLVNFEQVFRTYHPQMPKENRRVL